jgi:hypothetical protein
MDQSEVVDARAVKAPSGILAWFWREASRVKQFRGPNVVDHMGDHALVRVPSTNLLTSELLPPREIENH